MGNGLHRFHLFCRHQRWWWWRSLPFQSFLCRGRWHGFWVISLLWCNRYQISFCWHGREGWGDHRNFFGMWLWGLYCQRFWMPSCASVVNQICTHQDSGKTPWFYGWWYPEDGVHQYEVFYQLSQGFLVGYWSSYFGVEGSDPLQESWELNCRLWWGARVR